MSIKFTDADGNPIKFPASIDASVDLMYVRKGEIELTTALVDAIRGHYIECLEQSHPDRTSREYRLGIAALEVALDEVFTLYKAHLKFVD